MGASPQGDSSSKTGHGRPRKASVGTGRRPDALPVSLFGAQDQGSRGWRLSWSQVSGVDVDQRTS